MKLRTVPTILALTTATAVTAISTPAAADPYGTYRHGAESDTTLRVTWEVSRDGEWRMGDWLLCTKQG